MGSGSSFTLGSLVLSFQIAHAAFSVCLVVKAKGHKYFSQSAGAGDLPHKNTILSVTFMCSMLLFPHLSVLCSCVSLHNDY